jgi:hypothetical protein
MADTKFSEPEQDGAPEAPWTLIKQRRIHDLINAIKQTVVDDFQRIINLARDRPSTLADFTALNKDFFEMCEDFSIFTALTSCDLHHPLDLPRNLRLVFHCWTYCW